MGNVLKYGDLVCMRSTIPIITTRNLVADILKVHSGLRAGLDYNLAFTPERTIEGKA